MKGPGMLKGIVFAIAASLGGGLIITILPLVFSTAGTSSLIIMGLSLAYLIFLQKHSDVRRGSVVVFSVWIGLNLLSWLLGLSIIEQVLANISIIWIVRSLYFHSSVTAALLDLVLIAMAGGASVWAVLQTGSPIAAIWCFFLGQSLFGAIPEMSGRNKSGKPRPEQTEDHFQSAHRVAQDAIRKLSLS